MIAENTTEPDEFDITQYPYQVSILVKGQPACGGAIVNEKHVVTAASCLNGTEK